MYAYITSPPDAVWSDRRVYPPFGSPVRFYPKLKGGKQAAHRDRMDAR